MAATRKVLNATNIARIKEMIADVAPNISSGLTKFDGEVIEFSGTTLTTHQLVFHTLRDKMSIHLGLSTPLNDVKDINGTTYYLYTIWNDWKKTQ